MGELAVPRFRITVALEAQPGPAPGPTNATQPRRDAMKDAVQYVVPIAVLAVFAVLVLGLWNMMRGQNASLSQPLMPTPI